MHELENFEHYDVLLNMRGIVKHFPGVTALDGVDTPLDAGTLPPSGQAEPAARAVPSHDFR